MAKPDKKRLTTKKRVKKIIPVKVAKKKVLPKNLNLFPIIGLGCSAGGLEAASLLLKEIPAKANLAIIYVQHLDPGHKSQIVELLANTTSLTVIEAINGMKIQPGNVYVMPPAKGIAIVDGSIKLFARSHARVLHLPIDTFFQSLAEDRKNQAIGVVLSGSAQDGTAGLLAIRNEGGVTFAQEPTTARYDGMPRSAIADGHVDFVMTPEQIAKKLLWLSSHIIFRRKESLKVEPDLKDTEALQKIFLALRKNIYVDFSDYKKETILRRLNRRMLLLKLDTIELYSEYIESHPEELKELFADLLIHVTSFFRDPKAYLALKKNAIPKILKGREPNRPIRVWVPGCSTGEEAYSIAISIIECMEELSLKIPVQIFASDLSELALKKARTGIYQNLEQQISKEQLNRFFEKTDVGFRISKKIREICLFSRHDLTSDPPFAKIDLISCRNLLIYFSAELQKRIFPTFHYALAPKGILWLGSSESAATFPNLFSSLDKKNKLYTKLNVQSPMPFHFFSPSKPSVFSLPSKNILVAQAKLDVQKEAERIALEEYAPPSVVINSSMDVLHVRGRIAPFLEIGSGQASLNLLKMANPEIVASLRSAIELARKHGRTVEKTGLQVHSNGKRHFFNLRVAALPLVKNSIDHCFTVFFENGSSAKPQLGPSANSKIKTSATDAKNSRESNWRVLELQKQLDDSREHQQSLIETFDSAQEEITASNEELQSTNEELQSTNEELETAKEELQSTNEELTTVNDELNSRNQEMANISNDLTNLIASVDIPIVMVGPDLKIRRFTPKAGKLLKLIPTDVGRSIGDIKPEIGIMNLDELALEVMDSLNTLKLETKDKLGVWYQLQVRPYRTADNKIDGAVIALFEIDALKRANDDAKSIIEATPVPLLVLDPNKIVKIANEDFYETYQVSRDETEGTAFHEMGNGQWNTPALVQQLDLVLAKATEINNYEVEHNFPGIGPKIMHLNARRTQLAGTGSYILLVAIEDFTERRMNERNLKFSEEKFHNLLTSAYDGILIIGPDGTIDFANYQIEQMFGYNTGELLSKNHDVLVQEKFNLEHKDLQKQYQQNPVPRPMGRGQEILGVRKDGSLVPVDISLSPFISKGEKFVTCVIRDLTNLKELERSRTALLEKERSLRLEAEKSNKIKDEFLATLSHELRTPLTTILGWAQELKSMPFNSENIQEGLNVIERSAQLQGQLVSDLLDVSSERAGKLTLQHRNVNLAETLEAAIESASKIAQQKCIQIDQEFNESTFMISGDPTRLHQIFWNLLTNSIKFTPVGGKISVRLTHRDNTIQFQIIDTGIGINKEFIPRIFDRFSQADSSMNRIHGGLGLGLSIVRSLVELHKGTVSIDSPGEGKGTTVTVNLPALDGKDLALIESSFVDQKKDISKNLDGLKILVVDDSLDNLDLFSIMLKSLRANVLTAASVPAAIGVLKKESLDLIISDISMPGEDGYSLINKVRNDLRLKLPVIALTAHAAVEDVSRAIDAGFSAHISKPVEKSKLLEVISSLVLLKE